MVAGVVGVGCRVWVLVVDDGAAGMVYDVRNEDQGIVKVGQHLHLHTRDGDVDERKGKVRNLKL